MCEKSAEEKLAAELVMQGVWFFSLLYFALIRLTRVIFSQDTYGLLSYGKRDLGTSSRTLLRQQQKV